MAHHSPRQHAGPSARAQAQVDARTREDRAVALRLAGWSFQRIADDVGWASRQSAQAAWKRAVDRIPERNATAAKAEAVERALHMISVWLPAAAAGDLKADQRLAAWEERLAKLQGTDAPTRVHVARSPIDEEIERLAAELDARASTVDPTT